MAVPLLLLLLLPSPIHAYMDSVELADSMDFTARSDLDVEVDEEDSEAVPLFFGLPMEVLNRTREERAVEVLPGLQVPAQSLCPEDLALARMVSRVLAAHFVGCVPVLRYDRFLEGSCGVQRLLGGELRVGCTHGRLSGSVNSGSQSPVPRDGSCAVLVFLLRHVEDARAISRAGASHNSPLLLVTASPLWRVREFVDKWEGRPWKMVVIASAHRRQPMVSTEFLEPWFPNQISVAVRHEPPYSIHRPNETGAEWSGLEKTIFELLSEKLNFTYSTKFVPENEGTDRIREAVAGGSAEVGAGGLYFSSETPNLASTIPYYHDCAVFMTRASTALPRHRAILGPFQLVVWLVLTLVYLALSFAAALSPPPESASKKPVASATKLDAFWLVFGTFTNAFQVRGRTWSERVSIRILLTCYWIFTIIITAAYTSSIIAFVTLPIFPIAVDTAEEILATPDFRWATLGSSGWDKWLQDTDDTVSRRIQAGFEWVARVEDGVRNVSKSATYAFLGSRERLRHETSDELAGVLSGKKALHLGSQCFLPLLPAFVSTPALRPAIDPWLLQFHQYGFVVKALNDIAFQEHRRRLRSTSGGLRVEYARKMPHERRLSLEDVVGTFFVLGSGVIFGLVSLAGERVVHWWKVNQIAARIGSSVARARRKVSQLSGSTSGGSSRQSLRLRSGRIWSKGALGSVMEILAEPPDSPQHQELAEEGEEQQQPQPGTSMPHLDRDEAAARPDRPLSSAR